MAFAAQLFGYVQGADFYRQVHREAVSLLPRGDGRRWLDAGCGPGLVATLAAERGYHATGVDRDPAMIRSARRRASGVPGLDFVVGDLAGVAAEIGTADVVSAASLLIAASGRASLVSGLQQLVKPGGTLLVVETSKRMASVGACSAALRGVARGRRAWVLRLWAGVRYGRPAVDIRALVGPDRRIEHHALLAGLVDAYLVRQPLQA